MGGSELELVQFHFHTPSEHTFDGAHTSLEVHLVRGWRSVKFGLCGLGLCFLFTDH